MLVQFANWFMVHSTTMMLLIFVLLAAAAYLPGRRAKMRQYANIPLQDDR
jgi:cbb3-type cytochrome oxidase subunit 3